MTSQLPQINYLKHKRTVVGPYYILSKHNSLILQTKSVAAPCPLLSLHSTISYLYGMAVGI